MSVLYVIRHGQARYGEEDYDRLSPKGFEQARRLGRWLAKGRPFDEIVVGPRRRQRETAATLIEAAGWKNLPVLDEGLDEYPAELVIRRSLQGRTPPLDPEEWEPIFQDAMSRWVRGHLPDGDGGSFHDFSSRVRAALDGIMRRAGRKKRVAVVTSAGPTSVAMQMALGLSDEATLRMSWIVANTGIAELRFRERAADWSTVELTAIAFNTLPHLADEPGLVTYR